MNKQLSYSLSLAVVCYHSSQAELEQLIDSTIVALSYVNNELVLAPVCFTVIDNAESNGLGEAFLQSYTVQAAAVGLTFRLIQGHGNIGYGAGHNLAIANLESDFHLMLNPDVVIAEKALYEGLHYLTAHPKTLMAAPMAIGNDGQRRFLCKRYPNVMTLFIRGFLPSSLQNVMFSARLANYEMWDLEDIQPTPNVPIVSGCYMLCRTKALQMVGGFDQNYFLYFEDFDLSLRLGNLGHISYLPQMKIRHGGGNAARKGLKHIGYFVRSGFRFFNRHGWRWFQQ